MKLKKLHLSLVTLSLLNTVHVQAFVGKIVLAKGNVVKLDKQGKRTPVKVGSQVSEGDQILTSANAGAKLVLQDLSEVQIGPSTNFKINAVKTGEPVDLSIIQGQVRTKVQKQANSSKIKLIMRSRTATMGVRGTEFQTVFNPTNQMTSAITLEGAVAMTQGGGTSSAADIVSTMSDPSKTVEVSQGQFSGLAPGQTQPTIPVKISPAQLNTLKDAPMIPEAGGKAPGQGVLSSAPKMISPVPPGLDAKLMGASMEQAKEMMEKMRQEMGAPQDGLGGGKEFTSQAPPEGFFDPSTGKMAPPAGGFVDMMTGLYLPPPPGSAFDANTGVFMPPPTMGGIDPKTGGFMPPQGFMLDPIKGFMTVAAGAKEASARQQEMVNGPGGGPMSSDGMPMGGRPGEMGGMPMGGRPGEMGGMPMDGKPGEMGGMPGGKPGEMGGMPMGGGMFGGMDPKMFGQMVGAPPPPGSQGTFTSFTPGANQSASEYQMTGMGGGMNAPPPGAFMPGNQPFNLPGTTFGQQTFTNYNPALCDYGCNAGTNTGNTAGAPPLPPPGTTTTISFTFL